MWACPQVIRGTLFDEFVVAHTLGWWGKAVIIRNLPMLWILSVGFELMELTFQHMLPNFNECWWDSWLLDVAICNFAGLLAGMATVRRVPAWPGAAMGSRRGAWDSGGCRCGARSPSGASSARSQQGPVVQGPGSGCAASCLRLAAAGCTGQVAAVSPTLTAGLAWAGTLARWSTTGGA